MSKEKARRHLMEKGYGPGTNYSTELVVELMKSHEDKENAELKAEVEKLNQKIETLRDKIPQAKYRSQRLSASDYAKGWNEALDEVEQLLTNNQQSDE